MRKIKNWPKKRGNFYILSFFFKLEKAKSVIVNKVGVSYIYRMNAIKGFFEAESTKCFFFSAHNANDALSPNANGEDRILHKIKWPTKGLVPIRANGQQNIKWS